MVLKSPCDPKCPERSATCHAECKKWKEYEAKRAIEYEERDKKRRGTYSHNDRVAVNDKYKYILRSGKDIKSW